MTPLPATQTGVVRVRMFHAVGADSNAESSLYLAYGGSGVTAAGLTALANQVASEWSSTVQFMAHATCQLIEVQCTDLQNPVTTAGVWTGSHAGSLAGHELTAETCLLINHHVARRYRGGRPRLYLPYGDAEQLSTPQLWSSSFLSTVATEWGAFINNISTWPGPPAVTGLCAVSYYQGHTWHQNTANGNWTKVPTLRPIPQVDPVTGWTANPTPGSQRRRMGR